MTSSAKHRSPSPPGFPWELFCIVLIILSTVGVIAAVVTAAANDQDLAVSLVLTMLALLVLTVSVTPVLTNKFRKRRRSVSARVVKNDTRPPVLYLRSFKDDEKLARATAFYSIEQEMCVALSEIGPVVAMAEPDEPDPVDSGAARMQLHRDTWQQQVAEEMSRAALVIMRVGNSDGFCWELSEVPKRVKPERLVLLLRAEDEELYEGLRERAREWLPCELPEYKPTKWPSSPRGAIIYFERNWTPHLQKLKTLWLRQTFWNVFAPVLKMRLRPVYEQLGLEWKKPPVQPLQIVYLLVLCLLLFLFVYLTSTMLSNIRSIL